MFFGVEIDTSRAEGKQAFLILAEVVDEFLGVEGAVLGLVSRFGHRKWKLLITSPFLDLIEEPRNFQPTLEPPT